MILYVFLSFELAEAVGYLSMGPHNNKELLITDNPPYPLFKYTNLNIKTIWVEVWVDTNFLVRVVARYEIFKIKLFIICYKV